MFLQWSHQGLPFRCCWFPPLLLDWPLAARAELSVVAAAVCLPNMSFFQLSSLFTSAKASWIVGRGLVPRILPRTSSRSLLSPIRAWKAVFSPLSFYTWQCLRGNSNHTPHKHPIVASGEQEYCSSWWRLNPLDGDHEEQSQYQPVLLYFLWWNMFL